MAIFITWIRNSKEKMKKKIKILKDMVLNDFINQVISILKMNKELLKMFLDQLNQ